MAKIPHNWGEHFQAAAGGAATGGGVGSLSANPAGIALGAAGGGIAAFLASLIQHGLKNRQNKKSGTLGQQVGDQQNDNQFDAVRQVPNVTPEQASILNFLLNQGQQGLENPYGGFEDIENNARNQFSQYTVPSLAERFVSMGNSATTSPSYISQLGQAGSGLESNLALLKNQYGQQNQQNALSQISLGLSPQFQNLYNQNQPFQPSWQSNLLNQGIQNAPSIYQNYQQGQQNNQIRDLLSQLKAPNSRGI